MREKERDILIHETPLILQAVDFSVPFWEEALGVMVRTVDDIKLFTTFKPFSLYLWLCLLAFWLITSGSLRLLGLMLGYLGFHEDPGKTLSRSLRYYFRVCINQGRQNTINSKYKELQIHHGYACNNRSLSEVIKINSELIYWYCVKSDTELPLQASPRLIAFRT